MTRVTLTLLTLFTSSAAAGESLDGTWLVREARMGPGSVASRVWDSTVKFDGGRFTVTNFMGAGKSITGRFELGEVDGKAQPITLSWDELDFKPAMPVKLPAEKREGIFERRGDTLRLAFPFEADGGRPKSFTAQDEGRDVTLTLVKAPAGFKAFPKTVKVKVLSPEGAAAAGVEVGTRMFRNSLAAKGQPTRGLQNAVKAGPDGVAEFAYDKLRFSPLVAWDRANKLVALRVLSPAELAAGGCILRLRGACHVTGKITSPVLKKAGGELSFTNAYLQKDGHRVGFSMSRDGAIEFDVPPGEYTIRAYGEGLLDRVMKFTVPEGKAEHAVGPVELSVTRLVLLRGKAAPPLRHVHGWKGEPVQISDLKGRVVILDFWGYWCGPCVYSMPKLFKLYNAYKDKGLVIIGVHVDNGESKDAADLDRRVAQYRKTLWKGQDIPYPVALTVRKADKPGRVPGDEYGVTGYPTAVLIGRDGKVVGKIPAQNYSAAEAAVKQALKAKE